MTRLEKERVAAGLSQLELALRGAVAQSTVSKIETGRLRAPSFNVLARLAAALRRCGCDVDAADLNPGSVRLVTGTRPTRRRRVGDSDRNEKKTIRPGREMSS
jgi:transcriptional regulator with XRE-family HTH domain